MPLPSTYPSVLSFELHLFPAHAPLCPSENAVNPHSVICCSCYLLALTTAVGQQDWKGRAFCGRAEVWSSIPSFHACTSLQRHSEQFPKTSPTSAYYKSLHSVDFLIAGDFLSVLMTIDSFEAWLLLIYFHHIDKTYEKSAFQSLFYYLCCHLTKQNKKVMVFMYSLW